MFMIRNGEHSILDLHCESGEHVLTDLTTATKYLFGNTSKESLIEIPQGKLYLVRPHSLKGTSELIFNDAAASIRRTAQPFQYQLVIQRAYEEGEAELAAEEDEDEDAALATDKDEKIFLLDASLQFRSDRKDGQAVFAWRDLSGDSDDLYEFVCDESIKDAEITTFEVVAIECQYERKFRKSKDNATEKELQLFNFEKEPVPDASPAASPIVKPVTAESDKPAGAAKERHARDKTEKAVAKVVGSGTTVAPKAVAQPISRDVLASERAELHLFDFDSGTFILQDPSVIATVHEIGTWQYWLQITGEAREWLGQRIEPELNPVFNFEYLSFIFNYYTDDGSAYSWLLRFKSTETEERFQEGVMSALWERLNEAKWKKIDKDDQQYVMDAFQDLTMEDAPSMEEEEEVYEDAQEDDQQSEHYDTDEDADDVVTRDQDGNVNSQLAVGYKHDRSFVVRGSKIGVFKHTPNNNLEFSTNISKVTTPKGELFSPKKVMLHAEDSNMILQNEKNPNSLYRMDLEYGKVVDEWKMHDDIPVKSFAPDKKFAQMTAEQTFLGLNDNSLFRVDPRLSGNKIVESQMKTYTAKNKFSNAATTEKGYIAVASEKGDIRMFDRLGVRAKTQIPQMGEAIIGVDVSADGRWILATCRTYLLLIDAMNKDGKNEGKLGFEAYFDKDKKPQPKRLTISPEHMAQMQYVTKKPLVFTPAHFNTGVDDKETSIITATGPYIITWNMEKVLNKRRQQYAVKRYDEEVKADDFKYGSDKNVIVALPNEVNMVAKKSFKKPTRESIATASTPRRSSGRRRLGREEVVNTPY
ncbi:uncharacterized protein KY384_005955 [Bacidia gigantensis]|uniref:uncharacterized protein n=1 Tax=Bacidia gigantensis TaxID=2732470 RepID=UPI001D03D453|nr:uncharacterized protein KY384_005955 [Bacidia gigantensis]KAG8529319.1 hypothetical protein KY384_005955 [Bacidia gigantensis]